MKRSMTTLAVCMLLILCNTPFSSAQQPRNLTIHDLFTDHIVLQQQQNVPVWGTAAPGITITIKGSWDKHAVTTSDAHGKWQVALATPKAGGPFDMTITSQEQQILLSDVLIGEVWLASGQSNMQMPLTGFLQNNEPVDNYVTEIANADFPEIREFTVDRYYSAHKSAKTNGKWTVCSPENAKNFSATAYFYARKLHQELGVPIGIINSSWGGTVAEAWTSEAGLKNFPHFLTTLETFKNDRSAEWITQFSTIERPKNLAEFEAMGNTIPQFSSSEFDSTNWQKIILPLSECTLQTFVPDAENEQALHGSFWYRKIITLNNINSDYVLTIGAIDDADITYINGHKVGATWNYSKKRHYKVPKAILKAGENTIAINHYDASGGSAISGPIQFENNAGEVISLEGSWDGFFQGDLLNKNLVIYSKNDITKLKQRPFFPSGEPNDIPTSLYNGMIHPLQPFAIKGAIWYQGESNVGRAVEYQKLFPALIKDWRSAWGYDFPFYYVQIAPYNYSGNRNNISPELREAQRLSLAVKNTGMAVTLDVGQPTNIHPGNKQKVGDRLARLALTNDYGVKMVSNGPTLKNMTVNNGKAILEFDNLADGLILKESGTAEFELAGADKKYVAAKASIKGNTIILTAKSILNPVYARYGWQDYLTASLFNSADLPASSFTTENIDNN